MITILSQKHLTHDAAGRDVSIMYISLSSSADLPTKYDIPGIAIHEGSRAWDISTGKMYGFLESGGWQEQKVIINPMVLKGRVNSVSDLPSNAEPGWVYFVGAATDTNLQEYMYTESGNWDPIGYISITVDSQMSDSSENPVQNKVITAALSGKADGSTLTPMTEQEYEALVTKTEPLYFIYDP
jgi:hypothetical protein